MMTFEKVLEVFNDYLNKDSVLEVVNTKRGYTNLMASGKLVAYLDDIERQATEMFLRLVKELAEKENVTEKLKAENTLLWIRKMNNIRNRATEIVNVEVIYV